MTLFRRRDTRLWVLGLGGFAAMLPLTFALGTPDYAPAVQIPLGGVVFAAVAAAILRWRRALPPDLDLEWVAPDEAARLLATPPLPEATRLFVSFAQPIQFGRPVRADPVRPRRLDDALVDDLAAKGGRVQPGAEHVLVGCVELREREQRRQQEGGQGGVARFASQASDGGRHDVGMVEGQFGQRGNGMQHQQAVRRHEVR